MSEASIDPVQIKAILGRVAETLKTAEMGRDIFLSEHDDRKLSGLRNAIVFGRQVTFVMQTMRGRLPGFEQWYAPFQEEMKHDPLMAYFVQLRNEIEKEGKLTTNTMVSFADFTPAAVYEHSPPPPGTTQLCIGDQLGRSFYIVPQPDGNDIKYFISLPSEIVSSNIMLDKVPMVHLGSERGDLNAAEALQLYFDYLYGLFAKLQFFALGTLGKLRTDTP
ncbi:MAG TPA: hypothetical protein VHX44_09855 [Planctomycetota bacterium]|nr:hypothetical protein [Planctomycetota bacterium]